MRHRNTKKILDRKKGPRVSLMKNLAMQVLLHERIRTTESKAKAVQPIVDGLIRKSCEQTLAARRYLLAYLPTKKTADKCYDVLGPRFAGKRGGYTRILPVGIRKGDAAREAIIELV